MASTGSIPSIVSDAERKKQTQDEAERVEFESKRAAAWAELEREKVKRNAKITKIKKLLLENILISMVSAL